MCNRSPTFLRRLALFALLIAGLAPSRLAAQSPPPNTSQQLLFAGLLTVGQHGQFNGVAIDSTGNLYLLLDEHDGLRLLKTDPTATSVLATAHLGSQGDTGLALALDPSGNLYVTGTSTSSGTLTATAGVAFPNRSGTTTNSFVAKFDANLAPIFLTFTGSTETVAQSIAATADAIFITGSLFTPSLPVTPSAILQTPAFGSSQNGFVECFSSDGTTLIYATYLTGATGDTIPTAIGADPSDNAYIAGATTASGYPTVAALVPRMLTAPTQSASGFLTKLNPTGSGILFSTFIPGAGVSSLALDPIANNLLLSGTISLGQFPVASASMPLVDTPYQVVARIALDGSAVLASTVVAPGTTSFVTPSAAGSAWVTGALTLPLLPLAPLSSVGDSFAVHIATLEAPTAPASGYIEVDQTARFGGLPSSNPTFASLDLSLTSLTTDAAGNPILAGTAITSASQSLLATETFDLALTNPTAALPSTLQQAILPPSACAGSLCPGAGAYLAKLSTSPAPALALSIDTAPILTLRNLGSTEATGLQLTANSFTISDNCALNLPAGAECSLLLTGTGPGTVTAQAANAASRTASIPAFTSSAPANTIVVSPKELDFGVQTAASPPSTQTLTLTNLGITAQTVLSVLETPAATQFSETASDCPLSPTASPTGSLKLLPAGATCHITLSLTGSSNSAADGILQADWAIGPLTVLLTGFSQAAALNLSASEIDFGLQFAGGLHPARFLYLSNNSTSAVAHAAVALPATSPFSVTDLCPSPLNPASVCQLEISYRAAQSPSADAVTLALDDSLTVLLTGETLPQPGTTGTAVNPSLTATPIAVNFANSVPVTTLSTEIQTVLLTNTGTLAFSLATTLTGDFLQTTDCSAILAPTAHCTIALNFAPSQPGLRQGFLAISAGSGFAPTYVSLSGVATSILATNNGTLNLGSVPVGEPVTLWQKINQPFINLAASTTSKSFTVLEIEDVGFGYGQPASANFAQTAAANCSNCWLGIQFLPTAIGPETAILTLSSGPGNPYTIALTGTGLPLTGVLLSPFVADFGPLPIHSSTAAQLFTLTNLSSAAVTVAPPVFTGDFAVSPTITGGQACSGPLVPGASCFLEVAFSPNSAGPLTGSVALTTSNGAATAILTGYGLADPGLALNPTALIFNNVPGPTATVQTVTLRNTGAHLLQIAVPATHNPAFTESSPCATLAAGDTCAVTVVFLPTTANQSGVLNIPVTAFIGGDAYTTTYTVPLTGAYTAEDAGLQIIPAQANFGPTNTSSLGIARQFALNNLTQKQVATQFALPRQFVLVDPTGPPCLSLAPVNTCPLTVAFLPLTNGDITGTLFAQATPIDGSQTLNGLGYLEGYGVGSGTLKVTGAFQPTGVLGFPAVPSGQTTFLTLTLTNPGASPVTIRRITSEWPFLSTSTCGAKLALDQSCTLTVTYSPLNQHSSATSSPDAGILVLESDAASSPDLIDLTGISSPSAVTAPSNGAPLVTFTTSTGSLSFPATQVGNPSPSQTVILTNTGTATVHVTGLRTTSDFSLESSCAILLPGDTCPLSVTFTPQQGALGPRFSAVEMSSDATTSLEFISLYGAAATPANIVLTPASLNFGSVLVHTLSTLSIQVTNTGGLPSTFSSITTSGDYSTTGNCPSPGATLPAASSCTLQITFAPTATGPLTGTLSVATSATTLPLTVPLIGVGTLSQSQAQLRISPSALSFGDVVLGASANLPATFANTGTAPINNLQLALTGDYSLTKPCPSNTLPAGATCTATVSFSPSVVGNRPGALTITSSDPNSPAAVPLTGTGIGLAGTTLPNGSFLLTVNGAASASVTVLSGNPASFPLTLTPQNGFTGTVVLTCSAVVAVSNATCSLLPPNLALAGNASQSAAATVNTITSVATAAAATPAPPGNHFVLCLVTPGVLVSLVLGIGSRRRRPSRHAKLLVWWAAFSTLLLAPLSGCGSGYGIDSNLRYTPAGTYQYQVTASSTSGPPLSQTVTLNLIVQ